MTTPWIAQIGRGALLAIATFTCSAQHFPPLDQDNPPKSRSLGNLTACMTARKSIPLDSSRPLFVFEFESPGASGFVSIDDKKIKTFKDERRLEVYAKVSAGNHMFMLHLDKPAMNTHMSSDNDFRYCRG